MDIDTDNEKKSAGRQTHFLTILMSIITAVSVILAARLAANATIDSANKVRLESCLKRIDEREMITRQKSAELLGSVGSFLGAIGTAKKFPEESSQKVIKAAFELTAYAPPELNKVAVRIGTTIYVGLTATTPHAQEEAIKTANVAFIGWNASYLNYMKSFDREREACSRETDQGSTLTNTSPEPTTERQGVLHGQEG